MKENILKLIIAILIIIIVILIILLVNKDKNTAQRSNNDGYNFTQGQNEIKKEEIVELKPDPSRNIIETPNWTENMTDDEKANFELQKSPDNVEIKIKEGSLSKAGLVLIIKDNNVIPYNYNEGNYFLKKFDGTNWVIVKPKIYDVTDMARTVDANREIELDIDFNERFDMLDDGKYRLVYQFERGSEDNIKTIDFDIK